MKYSKEERLEIGQKETGVDITFGISEESARRYRFLYRQSQGIENDSSRAHKGPVDTTALITPGEPASTSDDYSSMTRKELIEELMKSKTRETQLKKDIWRKELVQRRSISPPDHQEYHPKITLSPSSY